MKEFIKTVEEKHKMIANISKNTRNTKQLKQEHRYLSEYIYQ
jgi:hypothetical protein